MDLKELEQAKRRTGKIPVTEIAIEKIPFIEYKGLPRRESEIIFALTKEVLRLSKDENDSNEVAITYRIGSQSAGQPEIGICFGTEHGVDPLGDTMSGHLLMSGQALTVISMHNHPSTQTFSFVDIQFLIMYASVKMLVVVSNQGMVHYLVKEEAYQWEKADRMFHSYVKEIPEKASIDSILKVTEKFLKDCKEVGLYYGKGR